MLRVPLSVNEAVLPYLVNCKVPKDDKRGHKVLNDAFKTTKLHIDEIVAHVLEGHALNPALLDTDDKGHSVRKISAFRSAQLLFLDIDNSIKEDGNKRRLTDAEGYLSLDAVIARPAIKSKAYLVYTSSSHTPQWNRFRIVFCLPEPVDSASKYKEILKAFIRKSGADEACGNPVNIYYGNSNAEVHQYGNVLTWQDVDQVLAWASNIDKEERLHQKSAPTSPVPLEQAREMLKYIPAQQDYIDWVRVISGLTKVLPADEVEMIVNEWSPGKPGEVREKIRHQLEHVGFGTVVYLAKHNGWVDPAQTARAEAKKVGRPSHAMILTGMPFHYTELGNAERLVEAFGDDVRYDAIADKWFVWDGRRFVVDLTSNITDRAKDVLRAIKEDVNLTDDPEKQKAIRAWAHYSEKRSIIDNSLNLARRGTKLAITTHDFDADRYLLNCSNGIFDLKNFALLPHDRSKLLTKYVDIAFDDAATCPKWTDFLETIFDRDESMLDFIQRSVGYSLTGCTDEQHWWFCYGTGANGKSVFFNVLKMLLGDYYHKAPVEMILQSRSQNDRPTHDLAQIPGKRLVVTDELPDRRQIDAARIKNLTGDDQVNARFLFREGFRFESTAKLWVYGNHYPNTTDRDDGIWRRTLIVPFAVTIPQEQRRPMSALLDDFRAELPGILKWALNGLYLWRHEEDRLAIPDKVRLATDDVKRQTDVLGPFIDEFIVEMDAEKKVPSSEVYKTYKQWAVGAGEHPVSQKRLTKMLKERGWMSIDHRNMPHWVGKGLSSNATQDTGFL